LFLVSPLDGGVIDGLDVTNGFAMMPAVYGRRAYVLSNTGMLLGIHVDAPTQL
jgi:outer membrane protein assembly factor BamB